MLDRFGSNVVRVYPSSNECSSRMNRRTGTGWSGGTKSGSLHEVRKSHTIQVRVETLKGGRVKEDGTCERKQVRLIEKEILTGVRSERGKNCSDTTVFF